MTKKVGYTEGSVKKKLFYNAIPIAFGIGFAISLNIVDSFFIKLLGNEQAAALQFSFPVIMLISSVAMGIASGASAVISRSYGEGNMEKVQRLTSDSLIIALLLVALFILGGFLFFDYTFEIQGADETVMPYIRQYMYIWLSGMIFLVVPFLGNSAMRAIGDTKTPTMIMLVAVILNGILDPLLIFGYLGFPRLEMEGAAYATIIARLVTLVVSIYVLKKKYNLINFSLCSFSKFKESFKEIMTVGLPSAITSVVMPMGIFIVNTFVEDYGVEALASLNIASRIEMITLVVFMALGGVLGPFIGQNFGADQTDRINKALKYSYYFALIWGTLMAVVLYLLSGPIANMIDKNDALFVKYTVAYLSIIPIAISFRGINMLVSTSFNVLKRPWYSLVVSLSSMFVLFVPLAFIFSKNFGYNGILWASVLASVITSILGSLWLKKYMKSLFSLA